MSRRIKYNGRGSFVMPVGWLFADLLLALAMIFLIANTVGPKLAPKPKPVVHLKPTPTIKPTPTLARSLILDPGRITIIITGNNPDNLAAGTPDAVTYLEQQIRQQITRKGYQHRRAGIAVAYGGADDYSQAGRADSVASEVYHVLDVLGQQKFVFCHTVHYEDLFTTLQPSSTVVLDIYFFSQSVGGC